MRLICPCCQAVASLEAWSGNVAARGALAAIAQLPGEVVRHIPHYLALFRPASSQGISWENAHKVVMELGALIAKGTVVHTHRVARSCPPTIWAEALATMLAQAGHVKRPLKGHGYLITIAYELADKADAQREHGVEINRVNRVVADTGVPKEFDWSQAVTPEEAAEIKSKSELFGRAYKNRTSQDSPGQKGDGVG
ncbi:MAG: hypothetical protein HQL74_05985 [Magnetococcales bacterium]|nr:hypothetical protein [Magnetococcales bacterium]